jgi:hypothetical protein
MARRQESDDERSRRFQRLGRKGKKRLGASIDALRATMPTDDFLEVLNATYPLDTVTVQAMTRVGSSGAPDWILDYGDLPHVPLLMGIVVARHVVWLIARGRLGRRRVSLIGGRPVCRGAARAPASADRALRRGPLRCSAPASSSSSRAAAPSCVA